MYSHGKRVSKKRRLRNLLDAMYRTDAVLPVTLPADGALLVLIWMVVELYRRQGADTPAIMLPGRVLAGALNLRRDDMQMVMDRIAREPPASRHLAWLDAGLSVAVDRELAELLSATTAALLEKTARGASPQRDVLSRVNALAARLLPAAAPCNPLQRAAPPVSLKSRCV